VASQKARKLNPALRRNVRTGSIADIDTYSITSSARESSAERKIGDDTIPGDWLDNLATTRPKHCRNSTGCKAATR